MKPTDISRYQTVVRKAGRFMLDALQSDGSLGDEATSLDCYYKNIASLALIGHTEEAMRVADFIQTRYMKDDGDFTGRSNPWFEEYPAYTNHWIAYGAHLIGRYDLSYRAMPHILKKQGPTGGFSAAQGRPYDILSTASAAHICLVTGFVEQARRAGDFILKLLEKQPRPDERFYVRSDAEGCPITEFSEEEASFFVVDTRRKRQLYFYYGFPMATLAKLYAATGDERYVRGGAQCFDFLLHCAEDRFRMPASGKVGWGSSIMARVTGEDRYREGAVAVADYLTETQHESGAWVHSLIYTQLDEQPPAITLDLTGEFIAWVKLICTELSLGG
ncbi:MAG: hypothetical protein KAJ81_03120 [Candidatus Latescibacteria bacterium]|nr:hypothetical protein [Candidatus Latescibacterota bacterium]